MVVMIEIQLPNDLHIIQITLFGGTCAGVIALMLISVLTTTQMLVAVLRYDCIRRKMPFDEFWYLEFEKDWQFSYWCFNTGVPLFLLVLAQIGWIIFSRYSAVSRSLASALVTVIATGVTAMWYQRIYPKWSKWNGKKGCSRCGHVHCHKNFTSDGDLSHACGDRQSPFFCGSRGPWCCHCSAQQSGL